MHKDLESKKHSWHHHRHHKGYKSIVKRESEDVSVPDVLLEVADIKQGDFLEITIRKVKKHHDEIKSND